MFNPLQWVRSALRPQVTLLNLCFYLVSALLSICFFVFVNASQAFILTDVIGVPLTNLGGATGSLALYDELISMLSVVVWGVLSDKSLGRRAVYSLGFLIIGIAVVAFPFAKNLYPHLLLIRLVFAVGAASTSAMLTAVLADFAKDEKRGLVAGSVGLVSGLGALLALFAFLPLPINLESSGNSPIKSIRITYAIVGAIAIAFGSTLWFFIRPPKPDETPSVDTESPAIDIDEEPASASDNINGSHSDAEKKTNAGDASTAVSLDGNGRQVEEPSVPSTKGYFALAKEGIYAAKNPKVALGYIGGFVARADSIILTLFITLYVNKWYLDEKQCRTFDPNLPNREVKKLCRVAFSRASVLSGTAQVCALIGALVFGGICDRISHELSMAAASLIGFIGFVLFSIGNSAEGALSIAGVVLMGFGQIGMIVVSLALVTTSEVKPDIRGSVAGVYSFFGAVGILLCSRLGGALFDSWTTVAPFILLAIFHAISFIASIAAWGMERYRVKQRVS